MLCFILSLLLSRGKASRNKLFGMNVEGRLIVVGGLRRIGCCGRRNLLLLLTIPCIWILRQGSLRHRSWWSWSFLLYDWCDSPCRSRNGRWGRRRIGRQWWKGRRRGLLRMNVETSFGFAVFTISTRSGLILGNQSFLFRLCRMSFSTTIFGERTNSSEIRHARFRTLLCISFIGIVSVNTAWASASCTIETLFYGLRRMRLQCHSFVVIDIILSSWHCLYPKKHKMKWDDGFILTLFTHQSVKSILGYRSYLLRQVLASMWRWPPAS